MKNRFVAFFLLAALALVSVGQSEEVKAEKNVSAFEAALVRLIARHNETMPFVVITEKKTGHFVQFAVDGDVVLVDLPFGALSQAEQQRAALLFKEVHREAVSVDIPLPDGGVKKMQTFQAFFGHDTASAAAFAHRIFKIVYRVPADSAFEIEEANQN